MTLRNFILPGVLVSGIIMGSLSLSAAKNYEPVGTYLNAVMGTWEFQSWWRIRIGVENIGGARGGFRLYCLNTDEVMEGNLVPGASMFQPFVNERGGLWRFNVNTNGSGSGLYAVAFED